MSTIDEIKSRIDLVDLVSETVKLKKSGHSFTGFCPFHSNTRTPSFVVWPDSGTWKCFGACNTGGDIFTYVMKRDGLEFRDALEFLARKAGVVLEARTPQAEAEDKQQDRLREASAAATTYFHNLLSTSPQGAIARQHLTQRGIADETSVKFQLGYSLDEWHSLEGYLRNRGYSREELVAAGLLVQRDDGTVFDRFRGRLMIPIRDAKGHTIGFGARTLTHEEPKYLNSPQSPLFDKGRALFGIDLARSAIREAKHAIVVEGYMDAIGAHQAGYANVVASMGTALTEAQFRQLSKLCKKFVLALDPDVAGVQAMLRGSDVAREKLDRRLAPVYDLYQTAQYGDRTGVDLRVMVMPGGRDPDEVIRDNPESWTRLAENALPVVQYFIETLAAGRNLNDPKEKSAFAAEIIPIIRDMTDRFGRAYYAQKLARLLRVDEHVVLQELIAATKPKAGKVAMSAGEIASQRVSDLEAHCLTALLQAPDALAQVNETFSAVELDLLNDDDFDDAAHRQVWTAIRSAAEQSIDDPRELLDESLWPFLATLSAGGVPLPSSKEMPDWTREAAQSALRLRERNLKRQQQELNILAREALEQSQPDVARELGEQGHRSALAVNRVQKALWPGEIARLSTADPWHRPAA